MIRLDKALKFNDKGTQIILTDRKKLSLSSVGWSEEDVLLGPERSGTPSSPGSVDTGDWMGAAVGAPYVFVNGGTYYLYFTSYKYYSNEWLPSIGVATASSISGPFTVQGAGPILEKAANSWASHGVFGCSVAANPNSGYTERLATRSNLSVEVIIYIDSTLDTNDVPLVSRYDVDGNLCWKLYLWMDTSKTPDRTSLRFGVMSGETWKETSSSGAGFNRTPEVGELIQCCGGFSQPDDTDILSMFLSLTTEGGMNGINGDYGVPGDVNASPGGSTIFLNDYNGTAWNNKVHLYACRINDEFLSYTYFQGLWGDITIADGLNYETWWADNALFGCNLNSDNYEYPSDEDGRESVRGVSTGMTWTAGKGISATANGHMLKLHEPRTDTYIMPVSGLSRVGTIEKTSLGYAYSDSLTSGWTLHEPPFITSKLTNGEISNPYISDRTKQLQSIAYPRLITISGTLNIIYVCEITDQEWLLLMEAIPELYNKMDYSYVLRRGSKHNSGAVSDFDYLGIPSAVMVEDEITIGGSDYIYSLFFGGDTEHESKRKFNIILTGRDDVI